MAQDTLRAIRAALRRVQQLETAGERQFVQAVNDLRRQVVLSVVEDQQIPYGDLTRIRQEINRVKVIYNERLSAVLSDNQRRLFVRGILYVDAATGVTPEMKPKLPWMDESVLGTLREYNADLVSGLTETAVRRVTQEVQLAALGHKPLGEVITAIGRNLKSPSIFRTIAERARIVANTELTRVFNIATTERMKQVSKLVPDVMKEWMHSHQGRPRPHHLALDGTRVSATGLFELMGEDGIVYRVSGPHDPRLPAGEVVNCKCTTRPVVLRFEEKT